MAFPTVQTRAANRTTTTNTTSHAITLPTGITAGDVLVVVFSTDGSPTVSVNTGVSGTNWNTIGQASNGTIVTGAVFWKIAEGSDALTLTTSASEQSSHVSLRISGANVVSGTSANGSSTNSNPPLHTPSAGTQDYLWIATRSGDSTVVATVAPTSFTNLQTQAAAGTGGASTNTAEYAFNASSLDPGTFTSASEQWVSWTLAVHNDTVDDLTANALASGQPTVGGPTFAQVHVLTATGPTAGTPTVGTPTLTENGGTDALTATGIASGTPTVGAPTITQAHVLTTTGIASGQPTVGTPAITQEHALGATGAASGTPTVGTPTLTQAHALTATGVASGTPTVGTPAIGQAHALTATAVASGTPTVGAPVPGQSHVLTATGIASGTPTVGTPTLTENGGTVDNLTATGIAAGSPTVGTPTLTDVGGSVNNLLANGLTLPAFIIGTPSLGRFVRRVSTPGSRSARGRFNNSRRTGRL